MGVLCAASFLEARASDCYQQRNHKRHHLFLAVLWPVQVRYFFSWAWKHRNVVWEHSVPLSNATVQGRDVETEEEETDFSEEVWTGSETGNSRPTKVYDVHKLWWWGPDMWQTANHTGSGREKKKNDRFRFVESPWHSWGNIQFCSLTKLPVETCLFV